MFRFYNVWIVLMNVLWMWGVEGGKLVFLYLCKQMGFEKGDVVRLERWGVWGV